jgi:predicted amino acid racemase
MTLVAITKAFSAIPQLVQAMLNGGAPILGDSRIQNIRRMRGFDAPMQLIRTPLMSQVEETVQSVDLSLNVNLDVIRALGQASQGRPHQVILMMELGDNREGIPPEDLIHVAQQVTQIDGVELAGIGGSLGCRYTIYPQLEQIQRLATMFNAVQSALGRTLPICSLGGTVTIPLMLQDAFPPEINQFRVGEALLLGEDAAGEQPIPHMRQDAFRVSAEVIETHAEKVILALGYQDISGENLIPLTEGVLKVDGWTSDHMILRVDRPFKVGQKVDFLPRYNGLVQLFTSPYVNRIYTY